MNCDHVIDDKLTKYPMIEDAFSKTSFNVILGSMGSGKTSLIVSLLRSIFKKCFHTIYVIMPPNSRASLENDIFSKLPDDQVFDDLHEEVLHTIYERAKEDAKEGFFSLLLIDDYQDRFKNHAIEKQLQKLILKMRHLKLSTFLLQQNVKSLPRNLRMLVSNYISFDLGKSQMMDLFEESIQLEKNKFQEVMDLAFQKRHDWMLINLRNKNIYAKFDRIVY
jgi:energy-coupling factor transporter ATP-binding protein EcfA2